MAKVKEGDRVKVRYKAKLKDGTEIGGTAEDEPFEYIVGKDQVIPGFERAVVGMDVGESRQALIPAHEAFGLRRDDLTAKVDRSKLPDDLDPEPGRRIQVQLAEDEVVSARITEVSDSTITIDANHPLAGRDLVVDIELVEVA